MTRVHPAPPPPPPPPRRRIRHDVAPPRQKKLRRLPHIFEKVLELPFRSDADVAVEETVHHFRFIVSTDEIEFGEDGVRAETVEIYPGVTKIVVRGFGGLDLGELEIDTWRFRLPERTLPEMATAEYGEGELVVTVPKEEEERERESEGGRFGDGRLVLVQ